MARPMPPARTEWDKDTLLWVAGLLEGEGSFYIVGTAARVACTMTDRDVIERLRDLTGIGTIQERKPAKPEWNTAWHWTLVRRLEVEPFCRALRPLMGTRRRQQIDDVLARLEATTWVSRGQQQMVVAT